MFPVRSSTLSLASSLTSKTRVTPAIYFSFSPIWLYNGNNTHPYDKVCLLLQMYSYFSFLKVTASIVILNYEPLTIVSMTLLLENSWRIGNYRNLPQMKAFNEIIIHCCWFLLENQCPAHPTGSDICLLKHCVSVKHVLLTSPLHVNSPVAAKELTILLLFLCIMTKASQMLVYCDEVCVLHYAAKHLLNVLLSSLQLYLKYVCRWNCLHFSWFSFPSMWTETTGFWWLSACQTGKYTSSIPCQLEMTPQCMWTNGGMSVIVQ